MSFQPEPVVINVHAVGQEVGRQQTRNRVKVEQFGFEFELFNSFCGLLQSYEVSGEKKMPAVSYKL